MLSMGLFKASVRAWSGFKYNVEYAAKLAKKKGNENGKARRLAEEKARQEKEKQQRSINPFSVSF